MNRISRSSPPKTPMKSLPYVVLLSMCLGTALAHGEDVKFNRDVRPILSNRCFHCHGPDEEHREAGLRLDRGEGPEGAYESVIEPGSPEDSELWARITSDDPDMLMPPPDSQKPPLDDAERAILRQWIEQGADYEGFWAFVPPAAPDIPTEFEGTPIDRFVWRRLSEEGLEPSERADKRTLLRRLSLDLTGLPPTLEEIQEFLQDDSPRAYENLVDRLLASPHFGEHMAKYWLDLVRFADTNGIHHDHYRDLSPYRDWVIRAFNDNLPYDEFTRYQIAGDLYPEADQDQLVASGFHRLHLIIDVGTALPQESFTRNVIDRVTSVGTAFMGLTVQCAVCHDHKYDPITMRDFYSLSAFFNNIDAEPETGGRRGPDFRRGLQPPYINLPDEQQAAQLAELKARVHAAEAELASAKAALEEPEEDPDAQQAEAEKQIKQAEQNLADAEQARDNLLVTIPAAMVMKERPEPRPAYMLIRGAYDKPGEQVQRDTPAFLPPLQAAEGEPTRMDLADWLVGREHPLTARVAVNRFWQQMFGVGIVRTSEDFGAQGAWPSHPDLLDYLTVAFIEGGWDVKALLKEIAMSETYRQTSVASPEAYQHDSANRLLARGSRFRLDSEVIRDSVLGTSGLLNPEILGKSVKPPQPEGLWKAVSMPSSFPRVFVPDEGDKIYRRSVYTFWKRGMPPPQMTIFDAPTREECIARRERTNTPLQALLMLNEREYLKAARHLARHVLSTCEASPGEQIDVIHETITSHLPAPDEKQALMKLATDLEALYAESPALVEELLGGETPPSDVPPARWAAFTLLTSSLYNLDIIKTRQ